MRRLWPVGLALAAGTLAFGDGVSPQTTTEPVPAELAREVESTARACSSIKEKTQRGYALKEIAAALLNLGEHEKAVAIADRREYAYWLIYLNAIDPLVRANQGKAAFGIVGKLEADHWKIGALLRIARSSADAKRPDDAIAALEKVRVLLRRSDPQWALLADIAELYARAGTRKKAVAVFDEAWKAYEAEKKKGERSSKGDLSQRSIVEIQTAAGFPEEAIRRAGKDQSWGLCQVAILLTKQGKDALGNRAAAKCVIGHRVWAFTKMAVIRADREAHDKAEATLTKAEQLVTAPEARRSMIAIARVRIGQPLEKVITDIAHLHASKWAELAVHLVDKKRTGEAKTCLRNALRRVPDAGGRYNQCFAMLKIAEAQHALGLADDARAILLRAKKTALAAIAADPSGDGEGNPILLIRIAGAQKKAGDTAAAKSTFKEAVKASGENHVRLREAVEGMAIAGLYDAAVQSAHRIKLSSPRQVAYQAIARAQGQAGEVREALAWIKRLASIEDRAFALSALTDGLRRRKR